MIISRSTWLIVLAVDIALSVGCHIAWGKWWLWVPVCVGIIGLVLLVDWIEGKAHSYTYT